MNHRLIHLVWKGNRNRAMGRAVRKQRNHRKLLVESLESRELMAADFQLFKDLDTTPARIGVVSNAAVLGNKAYYLTASQFQGNQLWSTDGTAAGSQLIKGIPGLSQGVTYTPISVNNKLFFATRNNLNSTLWTSDGTAVGTTPLMTGSGFGLFTNVGNYTYFVAGTPSTGVDLWRTDGTVLGTVPQEIVPGSGASVVDEMINANGTLFLSASNNAFGTELWKVTGPASTPSLVKDIYAGANSSSPYGFASLNGTLYFGATDSASGKELWKSDGTGVGTVRVKDIVPGSLDSSPSSMTVYNNQIYFAAFTASNGYELWKSDGTDGGTSLAVDFLPGRDSSFVSTIQAINGSLYVNASTSTGAAGVWKTDGTSAGTTLLVGLSEFSGLFFGLGTTVYFAGADTANGRELWKTNGTLAGTTIVKDIFAGAEGSNASDFTSLNGTLLFGASDPLGSAIWRSDGTNGGTQVVSSKPQTNRSSMPTGYTVAENKMYFSSASEGANGNQNRLWVTDGTASNTSQLVEFSTLGSGIQNLTPVGKNVYFTVIEPVIGAALWISDGTTNGTRSVFSGGLASIENLTEYDDQLFFLGMFLSSGSQFLRTDGTTAGTKIVYESANFGGATALTKVDDRLFFGANGPNGRGLWISNGTSSGTKEIKNGLTVFMIREVDDIAMIYASTVQNGTEIWQSNGTPNGTTLVLDAVPGSDGINVTRFVSGDELAFYATSDSASGRQSIWRSNGKPSGTFTVFDSKGPAYIPELITVGRKAYFTVAPLPSGSTPSSPVQLYVTEGAVGSTKLLKTLDSVMGLRAVNNTLYFTARDALRGNELWTSDGTVAGTQFAFDFTGDSGDGIPIPVNPSMVPFKNRVYVSAATNVTGVEIFSAPIRSDGSPVSPIRPHAKSNTEFGLPKHLNGSLEEVSVALNEDTQRRQRLIAMATASSVNSIVDSLVDEVFQSPAAWRSKMNSSKRR